MSNSHSTKMHMSKHMPQTFRKHKWFGLNYVFYVYITSNLYVQNWFLLFCINNNGNCYEKDNFVHQFTALNLTITGNESAIPLLYEVLF